ncbi:MAG: VOC family protein, partial [Bacteroidota bacterium]|nr:VOC family protein [Bacteroidota bacterium]
QKLEEMRNFYTTYFKGVCNEKYINPQKGFESYFIRFDGEATLELMKRTDVIQRLDEEHIGFTHLAFQVANKEQVYQLTEQLKVDGYKILSAPRVTGDGFFESVIADIDNNRIEIAAQ